MFLDKYFIINDFEKANFGSDIKPIIGIYDKWHPNNGSWKPEWAKSATSGVKVDTSRDYYPDEVLDQDKAKDTPKPNEDDGSISFWVIFLVLFLIGLVGVAFRVWGNKCYEKVYGSPGGEFAQSYMDKGADGTVYTANAGLIDDE